MHSIEEIENPEEPEENRRKGLERRWIKSKYAGTERRAGRDRRAKKPEPPPLFPSDEDAS